MNAYILVLETKKEWNDVSIPQPVTFASISKPDMRIQDKSLNHFHILDKLDGILELTCNKALSEENMTGETKSTKIQENTKVNNHNITTDFLKIFSLLSMFTLFIVNVKNLKKIIIAWIKQNYCQSFRKMKNFLTKLKTSVHLLKMRI